MSIGEFVTVENALILDRPDVPTVQVVPVVLPNEAETVVDDVLASFKSGHLAKRERMDKTRCGVKLLSVIGQRFSVKVQQEKA